MPEGDARGSTLFTLKVKSIAWKLRATEGCKLLRPITQIVTHLLYIDDLKAFAASESKLAGVMKVVKDGYGVHLNEEKKCAVAHVKIDG